MTENRQKSDQPITELGPATTKPAPKPRKRTSRGDNSKFIIEACQLMKDLHCENVVAYDVRGKSDVTDYIIIGSGTSDRQMRSVGSELEAVAAKADLKPYGKHIDGPTTWVIIDFVDAVFHLFEPQARAFYDLEMMWGDCPKVEWKR